MPPLVRSVVPARVQRRSPGAVTQISLTLGLVSTVLQLAQIPGTLNRRVSVLLAVRRWE